MEDYDIEPFMPAVSPGAPVPAPKYVPFNYSKMTPGRYFAHTSNFSDGFADNLRAEPKLVKDVYKNGIQVRLHSNAKTIHPTAWNYKIDAADLGNAAKNKLLMDRMTHPKGLSNPDLRSRPISVDTGTGQKFIVNSTPPKGAVHSKPKYATHPDRFHKPPVIPRKPGMAGTTFMMKGDPDMFHKAGPDYTHRADLPKPKKGSSSLSDVWNDGSKGSARTHTGHVGKGKVIGHVNPGSTQMMTKPGMMTGRMPMVRGLGGGIIDMFMEGPAMQEAKSNPLAGMGDDERAKIEAAYEYGL